MMTADKQATDNLKLEILIEEFYLEYFCSSNQILEKQWETWCWSVHCELRSDTESYLLVSLNSAQEKIMV